MSQLARNMDHGYIDQHDIAGRYLRRELSPSDRDAFQSHLVDCQECTDRVLLAEMFQAQETKATGEPEPIPIPNFIIQQEKLPLRARIVAHLSPWTLTLLLMLAVLLLLAVPGALFWWELQNVRPH